MFGKGMKISAGIVIIMMITIPLLESASATIYSSPYSNCTTIYDSGNSGSASSWTIEDPSFSSSTGIVTVELEINGWSASSATVWSCLTIQGNTFTPTSTSANVSYNWKLYTDVNLKCSSTSAYVKVTIYDWLYDVTSSSMKGSNKSAYWTVYADGTNLDKESILNTVWTIYQVYTGLDTTHTYRLNTGIVIKLYNPAVSGSPNIFVDMDIGGTSYTALNYERVVYL